MKWSSNLSLILNRLNTRLTVIFLALSLLPLIFVSYLVFTNERQHIEQNMIDHLTTITILKEAELNRWIEDIEQNLEHLASNPSVREKTALLVAVEPDSLEREANLIIIRNDHFEPTIEIEEDYLELFLLRAIDGLVLASTNPEREGMFHEIQPYFIEGRSRTYVQNVYYSMILEEAAMTIGTPVIDEEGNLIAVLAGRVNLAEMSKIMTQGTGMSETEETYLVNKFNFFVTDSRFEPGYALKKVIHTEGVKECLAHIDSNGLYDDYRGVPVIGVYRWIPERELCILAQVNQAETFEPINTLLFEVGRTGLALTLVVTLLALFFARSITEPVQQIVKGTEEIGRGNLDHKIEIKNQDEIGQLADAFNAMTAKRKQAGEALQESEENLRATLDGIGDGVIATDMEGKIVRMNPVAEQLTGWTKEEAHGRPLTEIFPIISEKTRQPVENPVAEVIQKDLIVGLGNSTLLINKDGIELPIADSAAPIFDAEGALTGVVLIFRDQTEERRAEQTLRDYSEQLEERVEESTQELRDAQEQLIRKERLAVLGELAGSVGHELRNPMTGITNAVYYLQTILSESDETVSEYLGIISQEVQSATNIVSALLDLARHKPPEKQKVGIPEIVTQVLERYPAPENVKVDTKIAAKLPDVYIDATQVGQVIENLIANATQAMPDGGKLTIKASKKGKRVHLSVTDNGVGISDENLKKIFEPLFTTKARGIGLGLALSKRLVEGNGGEIKVESQEGKGSTFTVVLPIV